MSGLHPVTRSRAVLGEGPVWYEGRLYWVDIEQGHVYCLDPDSGDEYRAELGVMVGCIAPRAPGGWVAAIPRGFAALDLPSGRLSLLAETVNDPRIRFNDGKCDPVGRFWAGTMEVSGRPGAGKLYTLETDGSVRERFGPVGCSNGIAWSLDRKTMYYIDTLSYELAAFDYDEVSGNIAGRRTVAKFPPEQGLPDGMTMDERGFLWIALWDGWCVVCVDPKTGSIQDRIELPVQRVTSCVFGGDDLRDLYITSARTGLSEEALRTQPYAGGVFRVRPGVKGLPCHAYAG